MIFSTFSLLKWDKTRKQQVNKLLELKPQTGFDIKDNKKYKIEPYKTTRFI